MGLITKTFEFTVNSEGWTYHPSGSLTGNWVSASPGYLDSQCTSAGTSTGYWEWSGTWLDLGLTLNGQIVLSVRLGEASTQIVQGQVDIGPYQILSGLDDSIIGELWSGRSASGTESGYTTTPEQPDIAIPLELQDWNSPIKLRLLHSHTNSGTTTELREDALQLDITYQDVGALGYQWPFQYSISGFTSNPGANLITGWGDSLGIGAPAIQGFIYARMTATSGTTSGYWEWEWGSAPTGITAFTAMRMSEFRTLLMAAGNSVTIGPVSLHEPDGTLIGEFYSGRTSTSNDTAVQSVGYTSKVAIPPELQPPDSGLKLRIYYEMTALGPLTDNPMVLVDSIWINIDTPPAAPGPPTPIGKSLQLVWHNLIPVASDEYQLVWDNLLSVSQDQQYVWDLAAQLPVTQELQWHLGGSTNQSLDIFWNAQATAASELELRWNQDRTITKQLQLVWHTRQLASSATQLRWHMFNLVGRSLSCSWQQRQLAANTAQLLWQIWRPIRTDPVKFRWVVRTLAQYTPRDEQMLEEAALSMQQLLQLRGPGGGGFNPHRYLELYGATILEPLPYEPDPVTHRSGYYYNSQLNQLFRRVYDRYEPERGIIVAHWDNY